MLPALLTLTFTTAAAFAVASLSYSFAEMARQWPVIRRALLALEV